MKSRHEKGMDAEIVCRGLKQRKNGFIQRACAAKTKMGVTSKRVCKRCKSKREGADRYTSKHFKNGTVDQKISTGTCTLCMSDMVEIRTAKLCVKCLVSCCRTGVFPSEKQERASWRDEAMEIASCVFLSKKSVYTEEYERQMALEARGVCTGACSVCCRK